MRSSDDLAALVVAAIEDAVRASSRGMDPREIPAQRLPHPVRVLDQGAREELDDRCRHRLGQAGANGPHSRRGQDQFVGRAARHGRSARTAATPRSTSPAAYAASASRMSARAAESLRTASVSYSSAKSSGLPGAKGQGLHRCLSLQPVWPLAPHVQVGDSDATMGEKTKHAIGGDETH